MIDILEEGVQRRHPLAHAAIEAVPLGRGDHPRDAVEGQDAVDRVGLGIDGEGDAEVEKIGLRRPCPASERREAQGGDAVPDRCRSTSVVPARRVKLAKKGAGIIAAERIFGCHVHSVASLLRQLATTQQAYTLR